MSGWTASLRLARRDAWRHKGRSALVVVMIGLPVAAIVFGDVAFRTLQLSPEQEVATQIGTAADAWVSAPTGRRLAQSPPGSESAIWDGRPIAGPRPTVEELVPEATQALETRLEFGGSGVTVATGTRSSDPSIRELAYDDPLAAGMVDQVTGRAPQTTGEVVLTETLASSLGVTVGDTVTVKDVPYTVVGTVRLPFGTDWDQVVGDLGAFPQLRFPAAPGSDDAYTGWLLAVPGGLDYTQWKTINALGSTLISRAVAADPPDPCDDAIPAQIRMCDMGVMSPYARQQLAEGAALVALVVVMGLLQVVLLVGPAFAIGRRRQAHDLALVAAVGGDARAVRRVVMAGGLTLGLAGGLAGLATGVLAFQALRPVVSDLAGSALFATDLRPELLVVLAVSTLTGLAAAWLPARQAARQDVVATLAGRRGVTQGRRWVPLAGAVALAFGMVVAFAGAVPGEPALLLLGCVVAELGLVAMAPSIVGWVSRLAPRLPTAPRFALRDAGRNRMRAGTAVAAVLAAVAGATALGVYVASDAANSERHYTSSVPVGYVGVASLTNGWPTPGPDLAAVTAALPTEQAVPMRGAPRGPCGFGRCGPWRVVVPAGDCGSDPEIECSQSFASIWAAWMVGESSAYLALTGRPADSAVSGALEQGGVVVAGYATAYVDDGEVELRNRRTGQTVTLPAAEAPVSEAGEQPRFELLLSPDAADTLDVPLQDFGVTVVTTRAPTGAELATARSALSEVAPRADVYRGLPFSSPSLLPLYLLLAAATLIAVVATATAVGLASADGRPDLATLAAVGAAPRMRRWLAASHAFLVSGLGTALGLVGGLVVGIAAVNASRDDYVGSYGESTPTLPLAVPWTSLAMLAVVVPLVAVVLAGVFTRSRLPMVQRID